jgi:hypothetical protein
MWLRPQTQLSVWLRSAFCWLLAVMFGLLFDSMHGDALELGLPLMAALVLLPLAFIGTWAATNSELPSWSKGRMLLYWTVVPGATLSTLILLAPLAAMVIASQVVALTLLTGIWAVRRGGMRALTAGES